MKWIIIAIAFICMGCSESIDPTKDYIISGNTIIKPNTYTVMISEDHRVIVRYAGRNYQPWEYDRVREFK